MAEPALSARPPGEVRCGRGRGGGGGSRGRGRGLVARVAAAQAASARPQPTAAAAVQAADAVPALEAAAALPVAADVQSHSDECKESPTSLAVPHGKGPACLGATDVSYAAAGQDDQFVRDEHARARAADASWEQWWRRLMDRGTVVEGILILDADTLHPWVFRGIEGYAAPAPMPEWAEPHLVEQHDEFEQLVGDAAEAGDVGDDEFERLVGPTAAPSPATGVARGSSTAVPPTPLPFSLSSPTSTSTTSSSSRRLCTTDVGSCELLSLLPAPEPAFDLTSLPGDGFDGNTDGLESRPSDGEEQDWMQAFEAAEDMAARAREQTSRSRWTSRDYSDLGVSWALEEERAEQAAEAAEYARRVVEMAEEEEGEGEEEDEAYGDPEAEALLRECVLDEILRRVGCPRELRVQLAQGGAPWLRLAGSRWWDRVVAAGFFLEDRDPGLSGGSWHDVGDGLRWVSTLGRSVGLRFGAPG